MGDLQGGFTGVSFPRPSVFGRLGVEDSLGVLDLEDLEMPIGSERLTC